MQSTSGIPKAVAVCLAVVILSGPAHCVGTAEHSTTALTILSITARQDPDLNEDCAGKLKPDLYGAGVRVGFYLQSLGTFLSIVTKRDTGDAPKVSWDTLWFHTALLSVVYHNAIGLELFPSEVYIALNLSWVLLAGEVLIISGFAEMQKEFRPTWADHLRHGFNMLLWTSEVIFSGWFWWKGTKVLPSNPCIGNDIIFPFMDLYTTQPVIIFFGVLNGLAAVFCLGTLFLVPRAICRSSLLFRPKWASHQLQADPPGTDLNRKIPIDIEGNLELRNAPCRPETPQYRRSSRYSDLSDYSETVRKGSKTNVMILGYGIALAWLVVVIELGIHFNGFRTVNTRETLISLGQLIPFIVGLGAFLNGAINFSRMMHQRGWKGNLQILRASVLNRT